MNPVIVIPTYWSSGPGNEGTYDHATPLLKPAPELDDCLASLEQVRGVLRVVVLVVCAAGEVEGARARVNAICAKYPLLHPLVIGAAEARAIQRAVSAVAPTMPGEPVSLCGYGAIRNMGLAIACVLGHDVVVFLDDDEIVTSQDFLITAVYGLGVPSRERIPIWCKSGYFFNREGSPYASDRRCAWYNRWLSRRREFNVWMRQALKGPRLSRSNYLCGGCMAVHAEAFTRVAFDPWITRGEDLDYLFNLKMFGMDVWFDNEWNLVHLPPKTSSPASRFLQDAYRWLYERAKLSAATNRLDLVPVYPASMMPYPGCMISNTISERIERTALACSVGKKEHAAYFSIWRTQRHEAEQYAFEHRGDYLAFQTFWPRIAQSLWCDNALAQSLLITGTPVRQMPVGDWLREGRLPKVDESTSDSQAGSDRATGVCG